MKIKKNSVKKIAIEWDKGSPAGRIQVKPGNIKSLVIRRGKGKILKDTFQFLSTNTCRLEIAVEGAIADNGTNNSIIRVMTEKNPFSFVLQDVKNDLPILISEYGVAVTTADDSRDYKKIHNSIAKKRLYTTLKQIEREPEEDYDKAAKNTRSLICPTWLGLSRDMRIFSIHSPSSDSWGSWLIQPKYSGSTIKSEENDNQLVRYNFLMGRGEACTINIKRGLDNGALPILNGTIKDGDIDYNFNTFVTLEKSELTAKNLRGSHFLISDKYNLGHMFTKSQNKWIEEVMEKEINRDEETVLYFRSEIVNNSNTPNYAWIKTIYPCFTENQFRYNATYSYSSKKGFGQVKSGKVFCISKLNGKPMPQEEMSILLAPGKTAVFEFIMPHLPITKNRADKLAKQDSIKKLIECRVFWENKSKSAAGISIPEKRIDNMVRAGLLHLDLISYGLEPNSTVAPAIGIYSPIGTESAPIIQFFDSMGWHDLARRCIQYFLDKQHRDGFIQNFGSYMVETGAVLWTMGEHYRYTQDDMWVKEIKAKLLKSCEYIIRWRDRNKKESLRGKGYGMIDGKVGDPEDPYHIFMLNGYAYLGLIRAAEMLEKIDTAKAGRLQEEALTLKKDIRESLFDSMTRSPVVPLKNGKWCPSAPPWPEATGPVSLFEEGKWFTHGTFTARDSLVGPHYLVYQEIVEKDEKITDWLLNYHAEIFCQRNVAFSQPYYSRHDYIHLIRGEAKAFLKTYYNGLSGLADRETYSFWEHYSHASPHKTHEEAWFLMQTRWMLYIEQGNTLELLKGIPRLWLKDGKSIKLSKAASYFGPISLNVKSELKKGYIKANLICKSRRKLQCIKLRLPHPEYKKAVCVEGGIYDSKSETVIVEFFKGSCEVILEFK